MKKPVKKNVMVYQAKNGAIELRGDFDKETLWATQIQIAEIFGIDRTVVTKHIGKVLKSKEIDEKSNVQKMHIANADRPVALYSLDIILAVGYRANSARAMQFRQWATKTLREHIAKGFTINPKVIKSHYGEFQKAIENIRHLLPIGTAIDHGSVLEIISAFAETWLSLDAYDKDTLVTKGSTKKSVAITAEELSVAIFDFKRVLIRKKEATAIFAQERSSGSIQGIVGNVLQSFGGKELYGTVEEKAAHLLYFIVKNHPFVDGNKRSGAYAFIWFLHKAGILDRSIITPSALTAITLLIAESDPTNKDRMTKLVVQLLKKEK